MSSSTLQLLRAIINGWWTLMTGWKLPGINITPAQLIFFMAVAPLTINFIKDLLSLTVHQVNVSDRGYKKQ